MKILSCTALIALLCLLSAKLWKIKRFTTLFDFGKTKNNAADGFDELERQEMVIIKNQFDAETPKRKMTNTDEAGSSHSENCENSKVIEEGDSDGEHFDDAKSISSCQLQITESDSEPNQAASILKIDQDESKWSAERISVQIGKDQEEREHSSHGELHRKERVDKMIVFVLTPFQFICVPFHFLRRFMVTHLLHIFSYYKILVKNYFMGRITGEF